MKKAYLIYPHQLFENIQLLQDSDIVYLIEEPLYFSEFRFHKQKLILHRASMKRYQEYLIGQGITVEYIEYHRLENTANIVSILKHNQINSVAFYDVVDDWLNTRLTQALDTESIEYTIHQSPMFLSSVSEFTEFFQARSGSRKYHMNDFYIWQRKRLNILVEDNKPQGGRWSFDTENRKKLPKTIDIPETFIPNTSPYVEEAKAYIEKHFSDNFGDTDMFWTPIDHKQAKKHLKDFLTQRFALFGPYEDAITQESASVFHSTISPLLNNGLLTPDFVLQETLALAEQQSIPLESVEGFIRQIIGWREYIRALYVLEGRTIRNRNYFEAHTPMPASLWTGTTGIDPVDYHIQILKKYAYTHHIPRLMVLGNYMNLCHIEPNAVYSWFMEMYIDAYDWVMVPNVYSMTLYADGGLLTTKPYIASSNYIRNMSDFKTGEWCEMFDALFWNFVGMHFEQLQKEGRLGFIGVQYAKMTEEKKETYRKRAQAHIDNLTLL